MLIFYSVLHLLVDGVCAYSMFSRFIPDGGSTAVLVYNFCAFALQMPLGVLLDRLPLKKINSSLLCSFAGACLTFAGALLSPVILGLGNALYHIGAGTDVIHEDRLTGKRGAKLGAFVAPGAIGLFIGRLLAGKAAAYAVLPAAGVLLLLPEIIMVIKKGRSVSSDDAASTFRYKDVPAVVLCFLVVVLRSFTGLSVHFNVASGFLFSAVSVAAVAAGKWLGGVIAARLGRPLTAAISLVFAAVCYLLSGISAAAAVAALLLFNMTMPVTLYEPVRRCPGAAGFFFGLLTFGLFLGFVPVWAEWQLPVPGGLTGAASCLISLLLLLPALSVKEASGCTTL